MGFVRYTLVILTLILITADCLAQAPFSRLELRIQGTQNVNRNLLHNYWHPASGVKVSAATPFYAGDWEVNLGVHRFNGSAEAPGFGALWISSGWRLKIPVTTRIRLKPGIGFGNYRMSFDESVTGYSGERRESDFVGSIGMLASLDVGRRWFLFGQAEYLRIQTQPLMRLWFISAGIGLKVNTGKFLQTLLE